MSDENNTGGRRKEYVEIIAGKFIEAIKNHNAPWQKPWNTDLGSSGRFMPYNASSGNDYKGINRINLMVEASYKGYSDPRWLTYKQAAALGAQVKKGEKSTKIEYWNFGKEVVKLDENGKPVLDKNGKEMKEFVKGRPFAMYSSVFNADQIDNMPPLPERPLPPEKERIAIAEAIMTNSGAEITNVPGDRAFYSPIRDSITLPMFEQFHEPMGYYSTALHELGHWTGHSSRLNRDLSHPFGSEGYAKEELRAEIGSLMTSDMLGLPHDPSNHESYVNSWIRVLQDDPNEIFRAAADAEKIASMLKGFEMEQTVQQEIENTEIITINAPTAVDPNEIVQSVEPNIAVARTYINVPFDEKNDAKELGAKWDAKEKSWYVPEGGELNAFERWNTKTHEAVISNDPNTDVRQAFKEALKAEGLIIDGLPQMDGQMVRVKVEGDTGRKQSGSYIGWNDLDTGGRPAGHIQNFRNGTKTNWKYSGNLATVKSKALSASERATLNARAAERTAKRDLEREETYQAVADNIVKHLNDYATPADNTHPYLSNKGVEAYGVFVDAKGGLLSPPNLSEDKQQSFSKAGNLLVPMRDVEGKIWGAQTIDTTGFKGMAKGAKMAGTFHLIEGDWKMQNVDSPVIITEGYATGAELHKQLDVPVVVAFSSNNLLAVAEAVREKYPEKNIVIAGDNDHIKEGKLLPDGRIMGNPGKEKALEAAEAVKGGAWIPEFTKNSLGTDWNDAVKEKGEGFAVNELHFQFRGVLRQLEAQKLGQKNEVKNASLDLKPEQKIRQQAREEKQTPKRARGR